ncbi:MAG: tRNA (guanine-N(1)-)-methyltransferase [Microgenomates bacterium 39_7]|nr:MAG: tRNA (guanine-N(1)-)-methyltransferase [Microgenomates bacterium 39_7]
MKINILTLFPSYFLTPLETSILGKSQERVDIEWQVVDIRQFAVDKHKTTDEPPYGGGAGMVMKIEPIDLALDSLGLKKGQPNKKIVLTSAKGKLFTQQAAAQYSKLTELTIICGHYEGVDERVAEHLIDEEVRIGDYVLTGGEPAAVVIMDAVVRLIPGVLGNQASLEDESHQELGKFSYPQYTRPVNYKGWEVPEILLSGDHQKIKKWRENKKG